MEIHQDNVPLQVWDDGSIRVGGTRVCLYLVIEAWQDGASPEYLVKQIYTSLTLADVYAAIAYYLRHKEELEPYFLAQEEESQKLIQQLKSAPEYQAQHQRLLDFKAEWERRQHEEARQ